MLTGCRVVWSVYFGDESAKDMPHLVVNFILLLA